VRQIRSQVAGQRPSQGLFSHRGQVANRQLEHELQGPVPSEARARAWQYLRDGLRADLALVQEASPPEIFDQVYRPIDQNRYRWGSAVVALRPGLKLRERPRVPLANCYLTPVSGDELPDSHPGACAVADVLDGENERQFTAVSLYAGSHRER
jgi:hypothetical protein